MPQYSCNFCYKTFSRTFNLRKHVANMHGQRSTTSSTVTSAAASASTTSEPASKRPRYDELVDDDPIFEYGCEVPECERCFRYFNSVEELRKHEDVKIFIHQNFTLSDLGLYTRYNFSILIAYVESWPDIISNLLSLEKLLWTCRATKVRERQSV